MIFKPLASALAKSHSTSNTSFSLKFRSLLPVKLTRFKIQPSRTIDLGEKLSRMRFSIVQSRTTTSGALNILAIESKGTRFEARSGASLLTGSFGDLLLCAFTEFVPDQKNRLSRRAL